jgi:hypothetical protein
MKQRKVINLKIHLNKIILLENIKFKKDID